MEEDTKEKAPEMIDASEYHPAPEKKARGKKAVEEVSVEATTESSRPMDIKAYLEEDKKSLGLLPIQVAAFVKQYRGRLLSYNQWKEIINQDLTRRVQ